MRIEPVTKPYEPDVAEALGKMMPPGSGVEPLALFRILARHKWLRQRVTSLGAVFLRSERLSLRERELAILRTTARCGCEYEWGVHVSWVSGPAGLTRADVAATLELGSTAHFDAADELVIRVVDALCASGTIDDALWAEAAARWDGVTLVELISLVGFYHLISFVANAAGAAPEPWAARFGDQGGQYG